MHSCSRPAVSVITPVYNTLPYLPRCLDSVLRQTLGGIEHILIDDGSDDGSQHLCDEYAARCPGRIRVLHQPHGGTGGARNPGLKLAEGEYVAFLDSDDYLHPSFLALLYQAAQAAQADICRGECITVDTAGHYSPPSHFNRHIRALGSKLGFFNNFWTALYAMDLIRAHQLHFKEHIIHGEDTLFQNEALLACRRLTFADNAYYYYCQRPGSNSGRQCGLSPPKVHSLITAYTQIAANLIAQESRDIAGMSFVFSSMIMVLISSTAAAAQDTGDGQRCWSFARELLELCPQPARGHALSRIAAGYPRYAAQLLASPAAPASAAGSAAAHKPHQG